MTWRPVVPPTPHMQPMPVPPSPDGKGSGSASPATEYVVQPDGTVAFGFALRGRQVTSLSVPYFTPQVTGQAIAFDVFPKGTPANFSGNTGVAWADICSTDIEADGVNYEALRLGVFAGGDAHLSHAAGGTGVVRNLRLQINGGKVGIGVSTAPAWLLTLNAAALPALGLQVSGVDKFFFGQATAAGNWFSNAAAGDHAIRGTGGALLMGTMASTGNYQFGIASNGSIYNPTHGTTTSAANLFINSTTGQIQRSTSTRLNKQDIQTLSDAAIVDALRPVTYRSRLPDDDPSRVQIGLIAEEVADSVPLLAFYDADGIPEGVQYDRVGVLALIALQDIRRRVTALETA